jgi:hypothetical protein
MRSGESQTILYRGFGRFGYFAPTFSLSIIGPSPIPVGVQMDFIPQLQRTINEKNSKHGRYRQRCDECWLLIVASGGRPSGLFEPSAETKNHLYQSLFERTFFMGHSAALWSS